MFRSRSEDEGSHIHRTSWMNLLRGTTPFAALRQPLLCSIQAGQSVCCICPVTWAGRQCTTESRNSALFTHAAHRGGSLLLTAVLHRTNGSLEEGAAKIISCSLHLLNDCVLLYPGFHNLSIFFRQVRWMLQRKGKFSKKF